MVIVASAGACSRWPALLRGDVAWGVEPVMARAEQDGAGLSVSPADDGKRQTGADQDDGRTRLDGGGAWLAGQGDHAAAGGLEPAAPHRSAAPQARSAAGDRSSTPSRSSRGSALPRSGLIASVGNTPRWSHRWTARSSRWVSCTATGATAENAFDELKNQWGWGELHDALTGSAADCSRAALRWIFNWWSLFVRLADLDHRPEAITSRPLLMQAIARQNPTRRAGDT